MYLYKLFIPWIQVIKLTLDAFLTWKTEAFIIFTLGKTDLRHELAVLSYSTHVMTMPEISLAAENLKVRQFDCQS